MHRFFVPPESFEAEVVSLPREVVHHLARVLRLARGAEVLLLDGRGQMCRCRIETLGQGVGSARVLQRWREDETAFPVRLLQGVPKGEKMELVLQKGTELGLTAFTPVLAGRTVPRLDGREEKRLVRWERIVAEAARQCRRPFLPRLDPPQPLTEALAASAEELRLMLWEEGALPLAGALCADAPKDAAILVGPEGGFSAAEAEAARRAGFVPVRMGPRVLRTETVGLAVAAILQFRYGDLGRTPRDDTALEPDER